MFLIRLMIYVLGVAICSCHDGRIKKIPKFDSLIYKRFYFRSIQFLFSSNKTLNFLKPLRWSFIFFTIRTSRCIYLSLATRNYCESNVLQNGFYVKNTLNIFQTNPLNPKTKRSIKCQLIFHKVSNTFTFSLSNQT